MAIALSKNGECEEAFAQLGLARRLHPHLHSDLLAFVLGCRLASQKDAAGEERFPGTENHEMQGYLTDLMKNDMSAKVMQEMLEACIAAAAQYKQFDAVLPGLAAALERLLSQLPDSAALSVASPDRLRQAQGGMAMALPIGTITQIALCISNQKKDFIVAKPHSSSTQEIEEQGSATHDVLKWLSPVCSALQTVHNLARSQQWSSSEKNNAVRICVGDVNCLLWHAHLGWNDVVSELQRGNSCSQSRLSVTRSVSEIIMTVANKHNFAHGAVAFFIAHCLKAAVGELARTDATVAEASGTAERHALMNQLLSQAELHFQHWQRAGAASEGAVDESVQWLQEALQQSEAALDASDLQTELMLVRVALNFLNPRQTAEQCMKTLDDLSDAGATASTLISVGDLLQRVQGGAFTSMAFKSYRRALQASMRSSNTDPVIRGNIFVGLSQTCQNDLVTQIHWFEQALQLDESSFSAESLTTLASVAWNTGRSRYQLGQYSMAKRLLQLGLRFARRGTGFTAQHIDALQQQLVGLEQLAVETEKAASGDHSSMLGLEDLAAKSEHLPQLTLHLGDKEQAALRELTDAGIFKDPHQQELSKAHDATAVAPTNPAQAAPKVDSKSEMKVLRARTPSMLQAPSRPPTAFRAIMEAETSISSNVGNAHVPKMGGAKRCRGNEELAVGVAAQELPATQQPHKRQAAHTALTAGDMQVEADVSSSSKAAEALLTLAQQPHAPDSAAVQGDADAAAAAQDGHDKSQTESPVDHSEALPQSTALVPKSGTEAAQASQA